MKKIDRRLFVAGILSCVYIGIAANQETSAKKDDGMFATLETNRGTIVIELFFKNTPLTVCNFVGLAEGTVDNDHVDPGEPYFDGMKWHRVVSNWVIQTGCPNGNGTGDPGYQFPCEIDTPTLMHDKPGVVGMANAGANTATNGSQFYITHGGIDDNPEYGRLNGGYTIFGQVVDSAGMKIVMAIIKDDKLNKVTVERVGAEAEAFKTDQHAWDSLYEDLTGIIPGSHKAAHPNPVKIKTGQGAIRCLFLQPGIVDVNVYTPTGRSLFTAARRKVSQGACTVSCRLRPGMYIVNVKQQGTVTSHKLVVQTY
jgi:cyclophilin family peptidyl-prolyl cis-trans isomerase